MDNYSDDWEYSWPNTSKPLNIEEDEKGKLLAALLDFSVNNEDLNRLESMIREFNPFKILGASDMEIRHSNVLAWLIDPNGHHGLGDTLFKEILLKILKDNNENKELPQIKDIISASFSDLIVLREWRNIDILAVSQSNKVVVVIENKINAGEAEQQLAKYVEIVEKRYPSKDDNYKKVFVFLTLDGSKPKGSRRYIVFTHEQVYDIVKSITEIRREYMHEKVYDFIRQYLKTLEEKTMRDTELIEICGKLYREHREAIKAILDYGKPKLPPECMKEFHKHTNTESLFADNESVNTLYNFIPCAWSGIIPINFKDKDKYPIFFYWRFRDYESYKITMHLYIGVFSDPGERERFIEQLDKAVEAEKECKLTVKKTSKTGPTIFSKSISLKYGSDTVYDLGDYKAVTEKLVQEYNDSDVQNALKVVDGVVREFWSKSADEQEEII